VRCVPLLREIRESLRPLVRYPSVSVVVPVRSEQRPGRVNPLRVDGLPECWLGKNHALYLGAEAAGGEWLLFTDADVRLSVGCVEDAIRCAAREDLDHLTLTPELISRGVALKNFVATLVLVFEITQRPWRVTDPRARESVGVESFNLLKREAYLRAGTHGAIRLRPNDDMRLARLLKETGFSQGVAYGTGSVTSSGTKHSPAPSRGSTRAYSQARTTGSRRSPRAPRHNQVALRDRRAGRGRHVRVRAEVFWGQSLPLYTALHLFGTAGLIYAMLRSAYAALANGGIEWRGTT
jgi:hypothetical protein